MKTKIFRLLCIALCVNILSCQKSNDVSTSTGTDPLQTFFNSLKRPTESFILNAQTGGQFMTTAGSRFVFNPNSFVDENGNTVIGSVTVSVNDFLTKKDLICNSISTITYGRAIESGGSFKITVSQGSKQLSMAPGKFYSAFLTTPYSDLQQMSVYTGLDTVTQYGNINWTMAYNSGSTINFATWDSLSMANYMQVTGLEWINCDHPVDSNCAPIVIHTDDEISNNANVVITCPSRFIVCEPRLDKTTGNANWDFALMTENLKAFLVYSKNNKFYYSEKSFLFNGQNITLPPATVISESDLEQKFNSL